MESDEDYDGDDETVNVGGVWYTIGAKRKRTVVDGDVEGIEMGQIAHVGEYRWKRVQEITEDSRKEPHFETTFKANMFHSDATEVDVFWALMPLSKDSLLNIILSLRAPIKAV